jgi:glycosyltransferase involved in cell wall biosynthesis
MREKYGWEPGACEIIPAPYDHDLLKYRSKDFIPRRIVSNSNPSRFFPHMVKVAEMLAAKGEEFEWHFCGGSQLYSPNYPEEYNLYSGPPQLIYRGCLPRHEMIGMLTLGHVLAYPTFHDIWETQGVAFLEAGALGLPVILTKIRPLTDVMPEALFCSSHEEFVEAILEAFKHTGRVEYPELVRYDSDVVFGKLLKIVNDLTGGPE